MRTTTIETTCLNFQQLESYSLNKCEVKERAELYLHISTCELCACAVNGFTAISFTSAEVDAIHRQIDVKTNVLHANPLTITQVFIAGISVASIFGFYQFAESFSVKDKPVPKTEIVAPPVLPVEQKVVVAEKEPLMTEVATQNNADAFAKEEIFQRNYTTVEPLSSITPDLLPVQLKNSELMDEHIFNSEVIYIYDLKVTGYNQLYFDHTLRSFEVRHTPANKETKLNPGERLKEPTEGMIAADKTLKSGLYYFTKGKYEEAIGEFSVLLENDPTDVNALFYSAVSYYHIREYRNTIKYLEKVLKSENNVFHPEAKWNLALSYLKAGEKQKSKELFTAIASEKGFYSIRATDKLKALGPL